MYYVHGRPTGGVRAITSGTAGTLHPEPVALGCPRAHAPRRSFALSLSLSRPRRPPRPGALSVSARPGTGAGRCIGLGLGDAQ